MLNKEKQFVCVVIIAEVDKVNKMTLDKMSAHEMTIDEIIFCQICVEWMTEYQRAVRIPARQPWKVAAEITPQMKRFLCLEKEKHFKMTQFGDSIATWYEMVVACCWV